MAEGSKIRCPECESDNVREHSEGAHPRVPCLTERERTMAATTIRTGLATCVRCQQEFTIGSRDRCPAVSDGGEHEATTIHFFNPGRFDGLCAEPIGNGLMCGFPHGEPQIHTEIPPEVAILR